MHEGFNVSTDFFIQSLIGVVIATIAFFFKRGESLSEKRIDNLEKNQEANTKKIGEIDSRVIAIEHSYVKQSDMRDLVDALREEVYCDLEKSFSRLHERIDGLFSVPTPPERRYPSESPRVSLERPNLEKKKK